MKSAVKFSALSLLALGMAGIGSATTYQIGSYGTASSAYGNQNTPMEFLPAWSNSGSGVPTSSDTYNIDPGLWNASLTGSSSWISYGQTGPTTPASSQPGGHFAPGGNYWFQTTFTLDTDATSFLFNILADDTVTVYLDSISGGSKLYTGAAAGNVVCQIDLPNCLIVDSVSSLDLPGLLELLTAGTHTLYFDLKQTKGVDMGLDFTGAIDTGGPVSPSPVPEPGTIFLLGTGLTGSVMTTIRRKRLTR